VASPSSPAHMLSIHNACESTPATLFGRCCWVQATKRIWAYIRDKELPKKVTKGKVAYTLDDTLAAALKRKTVSFGTLAKALAEHMKDNDMLVDAPPTSKGRR
jgi:chromatin remodeling complex protein RSC6